MSRKGKPNSVLRKYHYVYKLTLKDDERYYYIGKRSTNNEDDSKYMGSGKGLPEFRKKYGKDCFNKIILSYWDTSEEAFEEESRLVTREIINDEFCINRIVGGGSFDTTGCKWRKRTSEEIEQMRKRQLGKKASIKTKKKQSISIKKLWENEDYRNHQIEGRKGKYKKHLEQISKERIGKISIMKDGHWKYINKSDIEKYLNDGWEKRAKDLPSFEIILKYRHEGLSYAKIGKKYNCSESTIRRLLKNYKPQ